MDPPCYDCRFARASFASAGMRCRAPVSGPDARGVDDEEEVTDQLLGGIERSLLNKRLRPDTLRRRF